MDACMCVCVYMSKSYLCRRARNQTDRHSERESERERREREAGERESKMREKTTCTRKQRDKCIDRSYLHITV